MMRSSTFVTPIIACICGIIIGWLVQSQKKQIICKSDSDCKYICTRRKRCAAIKEAKKDVQIRQARAQVINQARQQGAAQAKAEQPPVPIVVAPPVAQQPATTTPDAGGQGGQTAADLLGI